MVGSSSPSLRPLFEAFYEAMAALGYRQGRNVHSKLIRSFAAPGGNLSGMSLLLSEMWEKRVELLHEIFPAVRRIGVPHNPACALDQRRQGDRMNQPQTGCMALRTTLRYSRQPVRSARAAPAVLKQACSTKTRHSGFGTLKAAIRRRSMPSNWHIL